MDADTITKSWSLVEKYKQTKIEGQTLHFKKAHYQTTKPTTVSNSAHLG